MTYPLTHAQQGIIMELMQRPGCMHYNLPIKVELPLAVDLEKLISSIETVITAHPNWKTKFTLSNGSIVQMYDESLEFHVRYLEMSDEALDKYTMDFIQPFDPFGEILVRFSVVKTPTRVMVLLDALHLVTDGLTFMNLIEDVSRVYNGEDPAVERKSVFEHALDHQAFDESPRHDEITKYYKELYLGKTIPTISPLGTVAEGNTVEEKVLLDRTAVDKACTEKGIRLAALLNAAYCALLSCYTRSNIVSYTTLLHGRDRLTKQTQGTFISTVPFYMEINPEESVKDFVSRAGSEFLGLMRRAEYSFTDFVKNTAFIPETIFSYQGPKIRTALRLGDIVSYAEQMRVAGNTDAPLGIVVYELDDDLEICAECSEARFPREYIRQFAESFAGVVSNMVADVDAPMRRISVLDAQQTEKMLSSCTSGMYPADECANVVEAVYSQAAKTPDALAVTSENEKYTYAELVAVIDRLASYFRSLGRPSEAIALQTSREAHTVAAMLAIMKAGMHYIPIDPSYPEDWISFIVENSGAGALLEDGTVVAQLSRPCDSCPFEEPLDAEEIAYMIYTSGSTGKPKGVMISHRALWSFVQGMRSIVSLSADDRISCHSSFSFDASVEDIFPVLTVGGSLHIVPESLRKDVAGLAQWLAQNRISGGNYTTRLGQMLMDTCELSSLRYIVLGGEKMTIWPKKARHIDTYNTYGPTEFTVDATFFKMDSSRDYDNIPIGKAFPGMTALVADHNGNPLPQGVAGEIVLSGSQLSSGYYSLPELTCKSFPESSIYQSGKYYRSGDVGMLNEHGEIEFLRRDDRQVKLNGFRIELAEIDNRINALEGVREAKTVVRNNGTLLCCYFVAGDGVDGEYIQEALGAVLPHYMIPKLMVKMDSLPLGPGGKLDVAALPAPSLHNQTERVLPETDDEVVMLRLVSEIMNRDDLGVTDDLLSCGISSLQIMELVVKAYESGIRINLSDAYGCRSIRELLSLGSEQTEAELIGGDDKPLAVLVCGLTGRRRLASLISRLEKRYAVLVLPVVAFDYDGSADDIIESYLKQLNRTPELVCGHSFGGELAYMLAKRINAVSGTAPAVRLYDTSFQLKNVDKIPASVISTLPKRLQLYLKLHDASHCLGYCGEVTLYSASKRSDEFKHVSLLVAREMDAEKNISRWSKSHPQITVVRLDCSHEDIILESFLKLCEDC